MASSPEEFEPQPSDPNLARTTSSSLFLRLWRLPSVCAVVSVRNLCLKHPVAFLLLIILALVVAAYLLGRSSSRVARPAKRLLPEGTISDYVVEVDEPIPKGMSAIAWDCKVSGISLPERRAALERMLEGEHWHLELEREPQNPGDANAIKVVAQWEQAGRHYCEQLGYVPRATALLISVEAPTAPLSANIVTIFKPRDGKSPGIRMNVWCPKGVRKRPKRR